MRLHHALLDVPRVARCMPGAILDRADGDEFSGRVVVKVGPLRMAYGSVPQHIPNTARSIS
jgi:carbon monoxide dehydrogenase subunit G